MSPELVLRAPLTLIYLGLYSLLVLPVGLRGAIHITSASHTPLRTGMATIGLLLVAWIAFAVMAIAGSTLGRLSAAGIQLHATDLFRYDVDVRWDQIDRIAVNPQHWLGPLLMIRLKDPDAAAGHRRILRWRMLRNRSRYGADVALALGGIRQGTKKIAEALPRLSDGLHQLEILPGTSAKPREETSTTEDDRA